MVAAVMLEVVPFSTSPRFLKVSRTSLSAPMTSLPLKMVNRPAAAVAARPALSAKSTTAVDMSRIPLMRSELMVLAINSVQVFLRMLVLASQVSSMTPISLSALPALCVVLSSISCIMSKFWTRAVSWLVRSLPPKLERTSNSSAWLTRPSSLALASAAMASIGLTTVPAASAAASASFA